MINKPKIIVILGPTASGKSDLAVSIAKKFNGEVISADSRQVYKGLDIGTGKITKKEMRGVPHYLLDVVSPKKTFSVEQYKKLADKKIEDIFKRNKLPIICGGTGFYIKNLVENISLPEVPPNAKLRASLKKLSTQELFKKLQKLDPARAENIDSKNPVRLIRAIEIATALGKVPEVISAPKYEALQIGIKTDDKTLRERILKRLLKRTKSGMIKEAENLHKSGLSWSKMEELGLEYRYMARLLQNKISKSEFISQLNSEIRHYAKRQITWFKKQKDIKWFELSEVKKIVSKVRNFI